MFSILRIKTLVYTSPGLTTFNCETVEWDREQRSLDTIVILKRVLLVGTKSVL